MFNTQTLQQLAIPKRGMPVTIITGFLGSGKTTLLNQILANRQNLKVAILVNEFGDINIDSQLLVSIDQDMMELSNGCICCTINDGLVDAVYRILERRDGHGPVFDHRIDYLVVETTGIADPLPIALTFVSTELRDFTRLDSILTLVDAETFTPEHFNSEAALSQITYGDIILLNKTDLVPPARVDNLEQQIRQLKAGARILRTQYGKVPLPIILDVGLAQSGSYTVPQAADLEDPGHRGHAGHGHGHHHHDHSHHSHHLENDGFVSVSFQSDLPFILDRFQNFLDFHLPDTVFRAKGVLWFRESQLRYIFQLSGKRYDMQTDDWKKPPCNQLVLIGRNLNTAQLQADLNRCLEPATTPIQFGA